MASVIILTASSGAVDSAQGASQTADPYAVGRTALVGPMILNVRTGPGTQYAIVDGGPLATGTVLTILDGQGPWLKVSVGDGTGRGGWVNSYYLTPQSAPPPGEPTAKPPHDLTVLPPADSTLPPAVAAASQTADPYAAGRTALVGPMILNVRTGPGTQYAIVDGGPLATGTVLTILDGQGPWLKVSVGDGTGRGGWVNSYYLTPQSAPPPGEPTAKPPHDLTVLPPADSTLPPAVAAAVQVAEAAECGGPTAPGFVTIETISGLTGPVYVLDHSKACTHGQPDPCHANGSCPLDVFANPTGKGYRAVLLTLVKNYKGTRQVDGQSVLYVTKDADACATPVGQSCTEELRFDGNKFVPLQIANQ